MYCGTETVTVLHTCGSSLL